MRVHEERKTEAVIYNIEENGKDIGMVINEKKTQINLNQCLQLP